MYYIVAGGLNIGNGLHDGFVDGSGKRQIPFTGFLGLSQNKSQVTFSPPNLPTNNTTYPSCVNMSIYTHP